MSKLLEIRDYRKRQRDNTEIKYFPCIIDLETVGSIELSASNVGFEVVLEIFIRSKMGILITDYDFYQNERKECLKFYEKIKALFEHWELWKKTMIISIKNG
jgi:hypothetical protein